MPIHPVLALAAVLILLRLPAALMAHQGVIVDFDEMTMTLNTADRFLGVPHVTTGWPGGTVQLFTVPLMALAYAIKSGLNFSADSFIGYLADLYRYPWHAIALTRAPGLVVSSLGIAMLYYPLSVVTSKPWVRVVGILLAGTLPFVWTYSQMASTDGMALGMVCASLGILGRQQTHNRLMIAGALFGLGIASKVTYILALPFVLAILYINRANLKREVFTFGCFATLGFIFACPYVWTDPVRYAKGVLGMSAKQGIRPTVPQLLQLFLSVSTLPFLGLYGLGLARFAKQRKTALLVGAIATWLLTMFVFSRSDGYVFDRYFLPSWVAFIFATTSGLDLISNRIARFLSDTNPSRWSTLAVVGIIGLPLFMNNSSGYIEFLAGVNSYRDPQWQLIEDLKNTACQKDVVVQAILYPYVTHLASNRSLEELRNNIEAVSEQSRQSVVTTIASKSIQPIWVRYIGSNFDAQEQSIKARLRVMQYREPPNPINIKLWGTDRDGERFGYLTNASLKDLISKGQVCALMSDSETLKALDIRGVEYGPYTLTKFRSATAPESSGSPSDSLP